MKDEDVSGKTAIYNMITAVEECKKANTVISYEQAVTMTKGSFVRRGYYVTEVSPLSVHEKISGFVVIFKDINPDQGEYAAASGQQGTDDEQERLAFLGQMIGGLAH